MMKRLTTLVLILFSLQSSIAQNLVPNGDFETYTSLPNAYAQYYLATGWSNVNNVTTGPPYGSPDYYHTAGGVGTVFGPLAPNTGSGQMGFYTYHAPLSDAREYVSTQLSSSLIAGQQYQLSFFLTNGTGGTGYQAGADNFGIHFSVAPLVQVIDEVIQLTPTIEIPGIIYITNTWQQYNFTFIAPTAANHVTFGNFELDGTTSISGPDNRAYYFIDDIVLTTTTLPLTVQGDSVICAGEQTTLTAINDSSYAWAINTAPSVILSTNATITVSPLVTTTYLVYGTSDTASFTVTVNNPPVVSLGADTTLCQGETLLLDATTTGGSYIWQDNSTGATINVSQSGTYFVSVSVNGCSATDTIIVAFTPAPLVNLGADTTLCAGQALTLNATVAGGTYLWQDNSSGSTYTVTQNGTYFVNVTANNCSTADTINVAFTPIPLVALGSDTTLCQGETLLLNVSIPNATYLWQDNSNGSTFNVTQSGTYFVSVSVNGCSATDTVNVAFTPLPLVNLGADTTLCAGQTIILNATVVGGTYLWQDNSSGSTYTVTQSGTYMVNVTANNCTTSDTISISYNPLPVVSLGNDTTLCQGETLVLNVSAPNATYLWQDNSTGSTFVASETGIYNVTVTINNCSAGDAVNVFFTALPTINIGADTTICIGETITLDATTSGATYLWNDNSGLSTLIVGEAGIYWAEVSVSGCRGTDSITVMMEDCEVILTIPNIFTPNNDGLNDLFVPIESKGVVELKTLIFNRYGQQVYSSSNLAIEWDGKTDSGNDVTDGTYFWIINYSGIKGTKHNLTGSLKLIR